MKRSKATDEPAGPGAGQSAGCSGCRGSAGCSGCGKTKNGGQGCPSQGCCGSGGCAGRGLALSEDEREILLLLAQIPFLPLARLVVRDRVTGLREPETLAPLYLRSADDPPETVVKTRSALLALEKKRLITLDYDKPLKNGDYSTYPASRLYGDILRDEETRDEPGAPEFEYGSIALTPLGLEALDGPDFA